MKKRTAHLLITAAIFSVCAVPVVAAPTLIESLQQSSVKVNFRLRYEDVSWDGLEDSNALTLRSRLSYQSGGFKGFGFSAEFDDVREVDDVDYRTAPNDENNLGTAIISDPEGTELNQAFISYNNFNNQVRYGRQRIILDNQRFVGGVGWRQNEQTYDAFSFANKSIRYTNIFYAYITNVNRIFGEENPSQGDHDQKTHLLNVNYTGFSAGKLTTYAYLIDNISAPALASDTFGVRWNGAVNDTFSYNLEYAKQTDAGDNPVDYSTDYLLGEAVLSLGRFTTTLGYEVLGSDDGVKGFTTPLATLHAFQGWTDLFLTTPNDGIKDAYVTVATTLGGVNLAATYHDIQSAKNGIDYGSEVDISASKKIGAVVYSAKFADYQKDDFGTDATKFWLTAEVNF